MKIGTMIRTAGITAAGAIGADQAAKVYVRDHHKPARVTTHDGKVGTLDVVYDPPWMDEGAIIYTENPGMLLGQIEQGGAPLIAGGLVALPAVIGATLVGGATAGGGRVGSVIRAASGVGAGLLAAGALSNGIEKLARGQATDYLFVSRQLIAWNLADVALAAGGTTAATALGARVIRGFMRGR
jgi:lipoprotein signal peptidase